MPGYLEVLTETFDVPADTPVLDANQVAMLREAGEELIADLLETFEAECAPRLDRIAECCAARDLAGLRENIHFVAGSGANLGLMRFAELCRCIELQIKEGRFRAFDLTPQYVSNEYAHGLADFLEG